MAEQSLLGNQMTTHSEFAAVAVDQVDAPRILAIATAAAETGDYSTEDKTKETRPSHSQTLCLLYTPPAARTFPLAA